MPPCKEYEIEIPLYATGDLEPERARQLATHLEQCAHCRTYWQEMQQLTRLLKPEPLTYDPAYGGELVVALNARISSRAPRKIQWRYVISFVGVMLLLIATTMIVNRRLFAPRSTQTGLDNYYSDLLNIGYFSELPLALSEEDNGHDLLHDQELITGVAANFLQKGSYLPVEHFVEVTAPLEETEFRAVINQLAAEPF